MRTVDKTGVEMEALTAAERRRADRLRHGQGRGEGRDDRAHPLVEKSGGKSGHWKRSQGAPEAASTTVQAGLAAPATMKTALVHSDDWPRFDYGPQHPLRMERLGLTWRLMQAYGLTRLPGDDRARARAGPRARDRALPHARVLEVLKASNTGPSRPRGGAFGLGPGDNPVFRGLWEAAQLVAGGSLLAADLVRGGEVDRVFHFAGGLHHAMPERASGFCYVNDAVLAILRLRERGLRVAYVDIDAHHGDGVQDAFYAIPTC